MPLSTKQWTGRIGLLLGSDSSMRSKYRYPLFYDMLRRSDRLSSAQAKFAGKRLRQGSILTPELLMLSWTAEKLAGLQMAVELLSDRLAAVEQALEDAKRGSGPSG
jgi:hypothetical protein